MNDGRVLLKAWISPEAKRGLEEWTAMHGSNVTAQIEAAGLWCAQQVAAGAEPGAGGPDVAEITALAVQVAYERRSGDRRRKK